MGLIITVMIVLVSVSAVSEQNTSEKTMGRSRQPSDRRGHSIGSRSLLPEKETPSASQDLAPSDEAASVTIGECSITAEPFVWRDYMPPANPAGSALRCVIRLKLAECSRWPTNIEIVGFRFENNAKVWKPKQWNDLDTGSITGRMIRMTGGPRWAPGTQLRIVITLEDTATNETVHLILENVVIQKTQ